MKTRFLLALVLFALALVTLPGQTARVLAIPSCSQVCGPDNCVGPTDCWCQATQQRVTGCSRCQPCAALR